MVIRRVKANKDTSVIRRWLWDIRMVRLEDVPHQALPFCQKGVDNGIDLLAHSAHLHGFSLAAETGLLTAWDFASRGDGNTKAATENVGLADYV
jgi:hypothetical protein